MSWAFQVVGECVWACVGVGMVHALERQSCGNDDEDDDVPVCVCVAGVVCAILLQRSVMKSTAVAVAGASPRVQPCAVEGPLDAAPEDVGCIGDALWDAGESPAVDAGVGVVVEESKASPLVAVGSGASSGRPVAVLVSALPKEGCVVPAGVCEPGVGACGIGAGVGVGAGVVGSVGDSELGVPEVAAGQAGSETPSCAHAEARAHAEAGHGLGGGNIGALGTAALAGP